jgi:excisionase family DNA binding protein
MTTVLAPRRRLMSIDEAAVYVGASRHSMLRLIAGGSVPTVKLPRLRKVLIDQHDLDELIRQSKALMRSTRETTNEGDEGE